VPWKAPGDGRYRLAIVARDKAGNQSAIPKGKADDQFVLTIDSTAPTILLSSAIGIIPADKAAANAQRDFKPGDKVQVPFVVKEVNPVAASVAIYLQTEANGPWKEVASKQPIDQTIRFDVPAVETKVARIKVTSVDAAGNTGETIASETFTIQTKVDVGPVEIKLDL
jgi:hypothetical protein